MLTFNLETVPLKEMRNPEDGSLRYKVGFPAYAWEGPPTAPSSAWR